MSLSRRECLAAAAAVAVGPRRHHRLAGDLLVAVVASSLGTSGVESERIALRLPAA